MKAAYSRPLIGIMTARTKKGSIAGNSKLFIELQKQLISQNGSSFVFTIEEIDSDFITGFTFSPDKKRWFKERFPYPDLIYNRIPFRKVEKNEQTQRFFSRLQEKKIPYFNPCFIDKFELYQVLNNDEILKSFLPKTILVQQKQELFSFLNKHKSLYLKPSQASKGKGIFRINLIDPLSIQVIGIHQQESYPTFDHFWEHWQTKLLEKNYLAQEEINSAKYAGNRFDFRILAHRDNHDYILTGVGIRQSQKQELTTHIPSGGKLLPYQLLQSNEHDQFIQTIVPLVGKALSDQFGNFGEFSIDAGVSKTGHYYIYEVNSKPMRFDESEIEKRKINQLCRLFLQLAKKQH